MATTWDLPSPRPGRSPQTTGRLDTKDVSIASHVELYAADEETLIRLLRSKMKYALAESGYDQEAQAKVSELVEKNVVSCGVTLNGNLDLDSVLDTDLVRSQLEELISGDLRVNSNEPVLLILCNENSSDASDTFSKNLCCTVLRDAFHIFPVRVYIAKHPHGKVSVSSFGNGLSIAILNVVNTDIGGPGMIELLDSTVASAEWERMVVSMEAWHHSDLLWRHDHQPAVEIFDEGSQVDHLDKVDAAEMRSTSQQMEPFTLQQNLESQELYAASTATQSEQEDGPFETAVSEGCAGDHPAMTELRAWEDSRPHIQHPSWDHSHGGGSLIDLVQTQVSGLEHSDAALSEESA